RLPIACSCSWPTCWDSATPITWLVCLPHQQLVWQCSFAARKHYCDGSCCLHVWWPRVLARRLLQHNPFARHTSPKSPRVNPPVASRKLEPIVRSANSRTSGSCTTSIVVSTESHR